MAYTISDPKDFRFTACKTYAVLVEYRGNQASRAVIPREYEGKPVKEIGDGVFADHWELEAVYLPPTLERIGVNAFGWTRRLRFVGVGDPEGSIPDQSVLPENLLCVESYAFQYSILANIRFLASEMELGEHAFLYSRVETVELPNCVELTLLGGCFANSKLKRFSAPNANAGIIPDAAFYNCTALATVEFLYDQVCDEAFYGCENLEKIHLPLVLRYVSPSAFVGCDKLAGKRRYLPKEKVIIEVPDSV